MHKPSVRLIVTCALCICLGITFCIIVNAIHKESIASFDGPIIGFIQGLETSWLTAFMIGISWIGSVYAVVPITLIGLILLSFVLHNRKQALLFFIVTVGTVLLNSTLKNYFKRDRPEIHRILDASGFSFPSGHAMMSFALYTILVYLSWHYVKKQSIRVILLLMAAFMILMIGISRIYLGVHYPSDIIGGYVVSALWIIIATTIYTYFQNEHKLR